MKSGMLAADATFKAISSANAAAAEAEESDSPEAVAPVDISEYQTLFDNSWIAKELFEIRNVRPSFHSKLKNWGGMIYSGFETLIFRGRTPWAATEKARCVELSSSSSFFYPPF
jgi:electron-transferring-flavoprotein dehydrogenase